MRMTIAGQGRPTSRLSNPRRVYAPAAEVGWPHGALWITLPRLRCVLMSIAASIAALAAVPACGYAEGASAVAWGRNPEYQLGAGFTTEHGVGGEAAPVTVAGLSNITGIAVGRGWSLVLLSDGTLRAWGSNTFGELGNGTNEGTHEKEGEPTEEHKSTVSGLGGVRAISVAANNALALLQDGELMAWGNDQAGQFGDGTSGTEKEREAEGTKDSGLTPKPVKALSNVATIASGGSSNFALLKNGTVMAWGENNKGQLGIGEVHGKTGPESCKTEVGLEPCSTIPRPVLLPKLATGVTVKAIAPGQVATYALLSNGHVLAWGDNGKGELGTGGRLIDFDTPQEIPGLSKVIAVSGGGEDALAVLEDGEAVGWGNSGNGDLGETGSTVPEETCQKMACHKTPEPIKGLKGVTAVSAGADFSFALSAGKLYAFGRDSDGKLGTGFKPAGCLPESEACPVPTAIAGIGPVTAISAGVRQAMALLQSGGTPPPPLLSASPGVKAMEVAWRIGEVEPGLERVLVKYFPLSSKQEMLSMQFPHPGGRESHVFSGLKPEPYKFNLSSGGPDQAVRSIIATPRP
jgi:alpha-tubulin suppressor-like RCC1 family protein